VKTPARCLVASACALCFWVVSEARADERPLRHTLDDRNLERTRAVSPQAVDDFLEAEELIRVGKLKEAEDLLRGASAAVPKSPILARRHCEVLTELGERERAIAKCRDMMPNAGWPTAMDYRAYAGALMSGSSLPTPDEVAVAVRSASAARNLVGQPFSDAAFCDIAHRLGDDLMFDKCIETLEREAPNHYETKRWASVKKSSAVWPLLLGWGLVALAGMVTLVHALLKKFRPQLLLRLTGALLTSVAVLTSGSTAVAQAAAPPERVPAGQPLPPGAKDDDYKWQLSQFRINHDNPEASLPNVEARNAHPLEFGYLLQDLASEAAYAEKRGDDRAAVKYWRAIAKAVPDSASGFSKACKAYYRLGELEPARDYCSRTLNLPGVTVGDYALYGELMTSKPGKPTALDIADVDAVIKHLRGIEGGALLAEQVQCQLGIQIEDPKRLETCTKALAKATPNDPQTLIFQWSYAMLRKDFGEAKRVVLAMKKTSVKPEAIAKMDQSTAKASAIWRRFGYDWRFQLGLAIVMLGGGGFWLRRWRASRRRAVVAAPPPSSPPAASGDHVAPSVG
jgi:hypothetical protein